MSSEAPVKDVEQQLMEAGEKLLQPPSSLDELLSVLNRAENALGKVEQSPGKSMHDALTSLRKALVSDKLLGHPDTDVKVSVASCISEITRITAPDAPYDDEKMKRVFQLIVSSFEDLSDKSSRSYNKRASILETVAKVRSCVIMLDLECDDLILEMFQIFFRTIRDYHPDGIFTSMETIMNLVLEESEEVSIDMLTTLLSSVDRENEEVPPIARRLGEKILGTSAAKLKPYLTQAIKNSDISLCDYNSQILTSVCEGIVGRDASNALVQQPIDGCKAAAASIVAQEGDGCKVAAASAEATQEDDGNNAAVASSEETQVVDGTKAPAASSEETQEDAKNMERDSLGDNPHSAKRSPKTIVCNGTNVISKEKPSVNGESSLKVCETDNKSTSDEVIAKPDSNAPGVEKSTLSESKKSKMISKNSKKKAISTSKLVGSSEPSHVDGEKEAKMPDKLDSHEKDTVSSLDEDISPEPKNVESDKETGDVEACNGDSNAASPSPSSGKANENLMKRDGHQQEKDCATQGEASSPGRVTEKEYELASDSEVASGESPDRKAHLESLLKDETSVEVATPKHADSGTSDSMGKLVKDPTKKFDLGDSDDDGAPLKKKATLIKRARTKVRSRKGASKFPGRVTEKESEIATDSEEASGESPDKKAHQESPSKDDTSVEVATPIHEDSGTSDSQDKLVKESTKKFDFRDSDDDGAPLKKKTDLIKRARTKARPRKGASKLSTKNDVKEVGSSQNRTAKSTKAEENEDEIFSKRKRSLGKDSSGSLKYGKNLIRSKIKVWWPLDHQFYEGVIVSYDPDKRKHKVLYDDGEEELLNLRKEKWQLVGDDSVTDDDAEPASTDASSEMPKSKKVKKSATSFVKHQDLDDVSPKRLSVSSRKSKGKSSTYGKRTKNVKAETKSKDVISKFGAPKSSGKAKDLDDSIPKSKSKQDTPKTAGKSKEATPKNAGKSKEGTPKTASKGKTPGTGSKHSANGAGKGKSSLSKGKGCNVQEKSSESPEPESAKRKLSDSSKEHGSEAKSAKKPKRGIKG